MMGGTSAVNSVSLRFLTLDEIQEFAWLVRNYKGDTDLIQGRRTVDAKSILGIYSLNIQKQMELLVHNGDFEQLRIQIGKFIR
ncbi:HPr family phosphocarrier protein [Muricomes intestini]|jgi:phosphotransferase system HPr-like phosphotransfer protein|uniref:HPr family phosphocarrier protein n=1 Tax=Muricomes intestini TaxID=1796634 RepID=UPI002FE2BC30